MGPFGVEQHVVGVEQSLQLVEARGRGLGDEPAFERLPVAFLLPAGLRVSRRGHDWVDALVAQPLLKDADPAGGTSGGERRAAVAEQQHRAPVPAHRGDHQRPGVLGVLLGAARVAKISREWSSITLRTHTAVPSASDQLVPSNCQQALGAGCSKRLKEDLGRLAGCGSTSPSRTRTRWIVRAEGTSTPARFSRAWIDLAPWSQPCRQSGPLGHDPPHQPRRGLVGTGPRPAGSGQ